MKELKKLRKTTVIKLKSIYKASKKGADAWDMKTIPIPVFEALVDGLFFDYKTKDPEARKFVDAYNDLLKTIKKVCKEKAKEMRTVRISVEYIKTVVKYTIKEFKKAAK